MDRLLASVLACSLLLSLAPACGNAGGTDTGSPDGTSGTTGTGGSTSKGGSSAKGGTSATAGSTGTGATSAGGSTGTGGASAAAGSIGTAGTTSSTGGTTSAGGSTGTGGNDTGGTSANAGSSSTAGTSSSAGSTGTGGASAAASLAILPADATLSPPMSVAPKLPYKAYVKSATAPDMDVTAQTTFTLDPPTFGTFAGATFSAPAGTLGMATVHASALGMTAQTSLTIAAPAVVIGPGADAGSPGKFGGADDAAAKPKLVYPASGIVLPPNMNTLEVHFIPAAGQTLFSLALSSPTVSLTAYFGCTPLNGGCVYIADKTFWTLLANTARGGAPVSYTLKGVNGSAPGKVGASATQTMQFSTEDVVGGIYYWNSGGTIQRYDFGFPSNVETYLDAPGAGAVFCVGCHVLSRDGTKMAAGLDIPSPAPFKVFDVATKQVLFQQGSTFGGGANFFSFSPEGSKLLFSNGVDIGLADAATGATLASVVLNGATMPDWSPDGKAVAYARPQTPPPCFGALCGAPGVDSASIGVMSYDGTTFSNAKDLVPFAGENNYYPAFSPDQAFVAFNRSPTNRNSFDNGSVNMMGQKPDGQVWVVPSSGGAPVQAANASQGKGDQWPKWAPTVYTYEGGKVMYMTVSSSRAYGLRLAEGDKTQLWMFAFDPQKSASGVDGTMPAYWLPFQDMGTGNHIAQWVTKVERKPCGSKAECATGEICDASGRCVPEKP